MCFRSSEGIIEGIPNGGTFFYFGDSLLARFTSEAFARAYGCSSDPKAFLEAFMRSGCYLIDLCPDPVNHLSNRQRKLMRNAGVPRLITQLRALKPQAVVVVMKALAPYVDLALEQAELTPGERLNLPFPAQGHQREYVDALATMLKRMLSVMGHRPGSHGRKRKIRRAQTH